MQVVFDLCVIQRSKPDVYGCQRLLTKASLQANDRHCGLKNHGLASHLAQLHDRAWVVAGLAQGHTIQIGNLV